ncbi:muramidase-released protein [Streptococcus hyointestinalis]|uniref:Muramidase-released protein n=1 Tax=Streptococcus hyointestinalis TaxID=1337 RepID=A0A380K0W6_9STRE|nr:MucBP domain-containing protein [Streptococcus hyointestinalis]SUN58210.1 muramidase-released protein [Streptococcus hyointestinalis]
MHLLVNHTIQLITKPNTITTEDGTTYELVRVDGSETGTVVGGKTTEVTYVYRKVTPAKKVVNKPR